MDCQNIMVSGRFPCFHIQFLIWIVKFLGVTRCQPERVECVFHVSTGKFNHKSCHSMQRVGWSFHVSTPTFKDRPLIMIGLDGCSTFPHPIFCTCTQNSRVQVEFHVSTLIFFMDCQNIMVSW